MPNLFSQLGCLQWIVNSLRRTFIFKGRCHSFPVKGEKLTLSFLFPTGKRKVLNFNGPRAIIFNVSNETDTLFDQIFYVPSSFEIVWGSKSLPILYTIFCHNFLLQFFCVLSLIFLRHTFWMMYDKNIRSKHLNKTPTATSFDRKTIC